MATNGKRVRISNSSLNSYGTRLLTSGADISQYERNPVMLYMHQRGSVVGYMNNIQIEGDDVTAEPVFDEVTDLSKQCKQQFEFGSLRMVSAGADIIEMGSDPSVLIPGQTCPTITKWKLFEVSLVDIGANDDAIVLRKDGKKIELGHGGLSNLPVINNKPKKEDMELKALALQLGLPETATEKDVNEKLAEMKSTAAKAVDLEKEKSELELSAITQSVETAIREKRLTEDKKQQFINLGKLVGVEKLQETLSAMNPQVKLSTVLGHQGAGVQTDREWKKLSDVPADKIMELRTNNPDSYKALYKAEYGVDCIIEK